MSNEKQSVSVRMPAELYNALKILSVAENRSLSGQIVHALGEWLGERIEEEQNQNYNESNLRDTWDLYFDGQPRAGAWDNRVPSMPRVNARVRINGKWENVSPSASRQPSVGSTFISPSMSPSPSPSPSPAPDSIHADNNIIHTFDLNIK